MYVCTYTVQCMPTWRSAIPVNRWWTTLCSVSTIWVVVMMSDVITHRKRREKNRLWISNCYVPSIYWLPFGCDVTRSRVISWRTWHRRAPPILCRTTLPTRRPLRHPSSTRSAGRPTSDTWPPCSAAAASRTAVRTIHTDTAGQNTDWLEQGFTIQKITQSYLSCMFWNMHILYTV